MHLETIRIWEQLTGSMWRALARKSLKTGETNDAC